jgi:hypothetical protein
MTTCARVARPCLVLVALTLACLGAAATLPGNRAFAADNVQVVKVEEDWELVVGTPDPGSAGPQITCTMSPTGNLNGVYSILTLNHRSHPSFVAGGMQLQVWNGDATLNAHNSADNGLLSTEGENASWTKTMSLSDGLLVFDIVNGSSTTWGEFGGLQTATTVELTNLNAYSPTVSVANSGVNFAANRVRSLVLKRVRLTLSSGDVLEDNTQRLVHQQD